MRAGAIAETCVFGHNEGRRTKRPLRPSTKERIPMPQPTPMRDQIEEVLLSESQIAERIKERGAQIMADYADRPAPLLIGVLRGRS